MSSVSYSVIIRLTHKDISEDIRNLYEFIGTGNASDELTKKLKSAVMKARINEAWRTQYMKEWVVIQDARDEGYEDGLEDGRGEAHFEVISRMLRSGKTAEEIAEFCGYPIEQVKAVKKEMLVSTALQPYPREVSHLHC